jgi:hypothetical protein
MPDHTIWFGLREIMHNDSFAAPISNLLTKKYVPIMIKTEGSKFAIWATLKLQDPTNPKQMLK